MGCNSDSHNYGVCDYVIIFLEILCLTAVVHEWLLHVYVYYGLECCIISYIVHHNINSVYSYGSSTLTSCFGGGFIVTVHILDMDIRYFGIAFNY